MEYNYISTFLLKLISILYLFSLQSEHYDIINL